MEIKRINSHIIYKNYVLTAVQNAFNEHVSWWISKEGYSVAYYCFSEDKNKMQDDNYAKMIIKNHIKYFDERIKNERRKIKCVK